jgi:hypothetical protein
MNCLATIIWSLWDKHTCVLILTRMGSRRIPKVYVVRWLTIEPTAIQHGLTQRPLAAGGPARLETIPHSIHRFPSEWSRLWHGFSYDSCT